MIGIDLRLGPIFISVVRCICISILMLQKDDFVRVVICGGSLSIKDGFSRQIDRYCHQLT